MMVGFFTTQERPNVVANALVGKSDLR